MISLIIAPNDFYLQYRLFALSKYCYFFGIKLISTLLIKVMAMAFLNWYLDHLLDFTLFKISFLDSTFN